MESGGPAPTGFRIYRMRLTAHGDVHIGTGGGDATTDTENTAHAEGMHEYSVRAVNDAGESGSHRREMFTTKAQNPGTPDAPDETDANQ